MRVLICGDRNWTNRQLIKKTLMSLWDDVDVVIEGEARGADTLGRKVAKELGIKIEAYPADWETFGRSAGPIRNQQMLVEGKPDLVIAFHNDLENSKGTADMIQRAVKNRIKVMRVSE